MRIGVTLPFAVSDGPGRLPTWQELHAFRSRTVGMDCELTDAGLTGGRSFGGHADELARARKIRGH